MAREAVLALLQAERSRMTLLDPHPRQLDDPARCTDAELIAAVRAGDRTAYAELYERHEPAARRMARQLSPSPHDVDDLVAEAFARVFDMLSSGRGPDTLFRAYLLTAVRNGMYERARRDRRLELSEDMGRHDQGVPWIDPVEAELDTALAVRAFASLPERWRTVLWYSEVEQETTAEVGNRLGLRPNAVAALAYRAREGLRQAFLQAHVSGCGDDACRYAADRLGGWTRERLAPGDAARVEAHLSTCRRCRQVAAELAEVNSGLRGLLAPLLAGGAASGWLASLVRDSAASGAASAGAGAGAASAGAAGSALSAGTLSTGTVSAATVAAAGAAGASVSGAVGSVAGGSVLGWLAGAHVGPAAAVLAAVVVGGTAVAAGVAVPHVVHRSPAGATGAAVAGTVEADELAPATSAGKSAKKHATPTSKGSAAAKKAGAAPHSANAAANASTGGQTGRGSANSQSGAEKNSQADAQGNGQASPPKDPRASVPGNGQPNAAQNDQAGEQANGQSSSPPRPPQSANTAQGTTAGAAGTNAAPPADGAAPGPASLPTSKAARSVLVSSAAAGSQNGTSAAAGGNTAGAADDSQD